MQILQLEHSSSRHAGHAGLSETSTAGKTTAGTHTYVSPTLTLKSRSSQDSCNSVYYWITTVLLCYCVCWSSLNYNMCHVCIPLCQWQPVARDIMFFGLSDRLILVNTISHEHLEGLSSNLVQIVTELSWPWYGTNIHLDSQTTWFNFLKSKVKVTVTSQNYFLPCKHVI